jgi:hypothetical protein
VNRRGNPKTLVAAHPGNLNAVKSGAHSPRLIEARADEIISELNVTEELDEAGRIALLEVGRLMALIEAIDRDLGERGVADRNGKERYLLQRRERYSRRLMEVTESLREAQVRSARRTMTPPSELKGEAVDYVRQLQFIALGHDPEAGVTHRLAALKC